MNRKAHVSYLKKGLNGLGSWGAALDASKPWVLYWILHALDLLEVSLDSTTIQRYKQIMKRRNRETHSIRSVATLKNWQLSTGGFGGGIDQLGHLATTYAAVNAIAITGTQEAYDLLDR